VKLDIYLGLGTEFYDLDKPIAPVKELSFYLECAQRAPGPILEPMCGSGRFLIPFMEAGLDISGFDASQHMLEVLYKRAESKKLKPKVWHGFLENLNSSHEYGLVFIPSGSFSLIIDPEFILLSLQKIYQSLKLGGLFVFEIETLLPSFGQFNVWRGLVEERVDGKKIVASFLDLPSKNNIASTLCKYELVDGYSVLKTEYEAMKLRLYEPSEMQGLLHQAGFKNIKIHKDFGHSKVINNEVVVFECQK